MLRIGITGQAGFIGTHLYNTLGLSPDKYVIIPFQDILFESPELLRNFVRQCDVIVHFAAMNRCEDPQLLYETNLNLVKDLILAMETEQITPHVLFSSSIQEDSDNAYGRSKREGRLLLEAWAGRSGASLTAMVLPNVYGPYGRPDYNSFVATFVHKLIQGGIPEVIEDSPVKLIYTGSLMKHIVDKIDSVASQADPGVERYVVPHDMEMKVSEVLHTLEKFKTLYFDQGIIPPLEDRNECNLFNTLRCQIDHAKHFPVKLISHADPRGIFVETIKLGVGGQVSFSTTGPNITRGNHYHTRKIERFTVIKGKARIQFRKIGTDEILNFYLDGREPAYVDIPLWYTHNITNIGTDDLYTQFWSNEWYDPQDEDTYFEPVDPDERYIVKM